ncbi:proteasome subunit alpha type-7 [Tanacetum coccineum]
MIDEWVVDQVGGHGGVFRFHVRSVRKIINLDDHVALACAGLKTDARVLINKERIECQNHKLTVEDHVEYITRLQLQTAWLLLAEFNRYNVIVGPDNA